MPVIKPNKSISVYYADAFPIGIRQLNKLEVLKNGIEPAFGNSAKLTNCKLLQLLAVHILNDETNLDIYRCAYLDLPFLAADFLRLSRSGYWW